MTKRQLAEKCDEPKCLNISQSYEFEWLPLLLLNQLHGQLLQRMSPPTVTSQVSGFPASQGTREKPSGCFPSDQLRSSGSLVHGMPAETRRPSNFG